jgi:hypothetical protein
MRFLVLAALAAVLVLPASAAAPQTSLSITTWLEGGRDKEAYTLTCGPTAVRGLPAGTLRAVNACAAVAELGLRLYAPSLSKHVKGCNYIQAPRGATLVGSRNGRTVRTRVEIGACERLLVPMRVLSRVLVWSPASRE